MIRIKVFPIRKIINRLEIALAYLSFITVVIILFAMLLDKINNTSTNLLESDIFSFNENDFIEKILKSKVQFLSCIDYDDYAEIEEQIDDKVFIENINTENNNDNIKVIVNPNEYIIPKKYDTCMLSNGKVRVGSVVINNYSKKILNIDELAIPSNYDITNNSRFLIFHTHTSETYTIESNEYSDYYRTQNEKLNMLSVGDVLYNSLANHGYNCIHDNTVHDYPSYNGAYKASLATVEKYLKDKDYDFIIDIHRDAISSNEKFRPVTSIDGKNVAKLMFVIGTDGAGLSHSNWIENLKLAILIQNRAEEMYPGLFREIHLSNSRYNQQVSDGAFIIEVGATGNSLEEAQNAMVYLAEVINSLKSK